VLRPLRGGQCHYSGTPGTPGFTDGHIVPWRDPPRRADAGQTFRADYDRRYGKMLRRQEVPWCAARSMVLH